VLRTLQSAPTTIPSVPAFSTVTCTSCGLPSRRAASAIRSSIPSTLSSLTRAWRARVRTRLRPCTKRTADAAIAFAGGVARESVLLLVPHAIATIVERGPIASACAADVVPMRRTQRVRPSGASLPTRSAVRLASARRVLRARLSGRLRARTGASFVDELRQPMVRTPGPPALARTRSTGVVDRSRRLRAMSAGRGFPR
jgi:hypothetical protein